MSLNNKIPHEFFHKANDDSQIDYPVHVYYIDISKMHMQRIRWHWHAQIEVIILNHGEIDFFTDNNQISLSAGQGMIVNQNIIHSIQSGEDKTHCGIYSLTFSPSFLLGYGNTQLSSKYIVPILSSPIFDTLLLDEKEPWQAKMLDSVNSIIASNVTKKYGYELMTKSYLCQFWVHLLEHVVPQNALSKRQPAVSIDEERVKEAILYLENHFQEAITLEQLANSIHISKSECCRCFKRTLSISPIEYLMRYRILQAANMIQNNLVYASISELSYLVGFNNVSYFNKLFKQYIKCTPSEYRKMNKNDPISASGPSNIFTF